MTFWNSNWNVDKEKSGLAINVWIKVLIIRFLKGVFKYSIVSSANQHWYTRFDFFVNSQHYKVDISVNHLFHLFESQSSGKFEERAPLIYWFIYWSAPCTLDNLFHIETQSFQACEHCQCCVNCEKLWTSFPIIHKVDNIDIIVQLLVEIHCSQLRTESISMQIDICQGALNSYWSAWFLYLTIFQNKQYKNANVANFVYYGKTPLIHFNVLLWGLPGYAASSLFEFSRNTQSWQHWHLIQMHRISHFFHKS